MMDFIDVKVILITLAKIMAGLIGGTSIAVFWLPEEVRKRSPQVRAGIIGGLSVAFPLVFSGLAMRWLGFKEDDVQGALTVSFVQGMISLACLKWVSNFLVKREKSDILDVAGEVRRGYQNNQPAPAPQPDPVPVQDPVIQQPGAVPTAPQP